jgi:sugar/nucleoside kinase (ribokinase family)
VTRGSSAALLFKATLHSSSSSSSNNDNSDTDTSNTTNANDDAVAAAEAVPATAASCCSQYWRYSTPQVAAVNATGAGDCTTAITLRSWVQGASPEVAFKTGLAAAGASCLK